MMRLLPSATFYGGYLLFSLAYIPAAVLLGTPTALLSLSHRSALRITRWLIRIYGAVSVRLAWPWVRVHVENRSGIAPGQPCLFISNHQSIGDPYLLALLPHEFVFVSNRWPFGIPVLGAFARLAGYLDAEASGPRAFLEKAARVLSQGVALFCFAEGTRTRTGEIGPFHATLFRLALEARVPVVPFCIAGFYRILPRGHFLLRPGTIHVRALPALVPAEFEHLTAHQLKHKVWGVIAAELALVEGGVPCA
ncbi:MAG: lysophospholipid acyltransferase family protein [Terrimicrobiaceae bacterium]